MYKKCSFIVKLVTKVIFIPQGYANACREVALSLLYNILPILF